MHVGVDGLHLFGQYSGVQRSLAGLVSGLRQVAPADEITLYVPRDFAGPPDAAGDAGLHLRRTWFPGRWRGVRTLWRNFRLQTRAYRDQCQVLHGPTYVLPSLLSMPAVVTLHDVIALTHPDFCTPGSSKAQALGLRRSVKVARRVIVPSEAVKRAVVAQLQLDPARIDVAPWGVDETFRVITEKSRLEEARAQWKLPERFVLFVGTLEPKKNLESLVSGFFAARAHRRLPHALVLAGRRGWKMKRFERLIREHNLQGHVFCTGYVPSAVLPRLYNLAELCVMPSHVEGFGMPVLEAFACGCPVLISPDPALNEVAGGAARAFTVDRNYPFRGLREAFEELLGEAGARARAELREKGLRRAREFTWRRTAELTRASYLRALE